MAIITCCPLALKSSTCCVQRSSGVWVMRFPQLMLTFAWLPFQTFPCPLTVQSTLRRLWMWFSSVWIKVDWLNMTVLHGVWKFSAWQASGTLRLQLATMASNEPLHLTWPLDAVCALPKMEMEDHPDGIFHQAFPAEPHNISQYSRYEGRRAPPPHPVHQQVVISQVLDTQPSVQNRDAVGQTRRLPSQLLTSTVLVPGAHYSRDVIPDIRATFTER